MELSLIRCQKESGERQGKSTTKRGRYKEEKKDGKEKPININPKEKKLD